MAMMKKRKKEKEKKEVNCCQHHDGESFESLRFNDLKGHIK
jgi:hypothetical protein